MTYEMFYDKLANDELVLADIYEMVGDALPLSHFQLEMDMRPDGHINVYACQVKSEDEHVRLMDAYADPTTPAGHAAIGFFRRLAMVLNTRCLLHGIDAGFSIKTGGYGIGWTLVVMRVTK